MQKEAIMAKVREPKGGTGDQDLRAETSKESCKQPVLDL